MSPASSRSTTGAVIVGGYGQDGRLLGEQLERAGCSVVPLGRNDVDLQDREQIVALLRRHQPGEIYYLAAHHHSSQDATGVDDAALFRSSFDVNVTGLVNFLEAVRAHSPRTRIFYAASSHIFGSSESSLQNEQTPFAPNGVYGITKTAGVHACRYYRQAHGVFVSAGILYNHESRYRAPNFVSQKIVRAVQEIAAGRRQRLVLGDLSVRIDWGYAPDYVDAMRRILALPSADDFVIATGESHSVQEFVETAFEAVGLVWREHVTVDPGQILRQYPGLTGDASKLRAATGWQPSVSFRKMVRILLEASRHE